MYAPGTLLFKKAQNHVFDLQLKVFQLLNIYFVCKHFTLSSHSSFENIEILDINTITIINHWTPLDNYPNNY